MTKSPMTILKHADCFCRAYRYRSKVEAREQDS